MGFIVFPFILDVLLTSTGHIEYKKIPYFSVLSQKLRDRSQKVWFFLNTILMSVKILKLPHVGVAEVKDFLV
jgi:hypothetical protein